MSANILIGITGSIAAYKSCDLISMLVKRGHQVRVIMTENATQFIPRLSVETIAKSRVHSEQFSGADGGTEHIALARWSQLACVAPASASFLCKLAYGIADSLLLTELLAFEGPLLVAPAMNPSMLKSYQVKEAIDRLRRHGIKFIDPYHGVLACGEEGVGKMALPETIFNAIEAELTLKDTTGQHKPLKGKRVLITAGPTRSYIDAVRFISNPSTGKMGFALAQAAKELGAEVTLVAGCCENLPEGIHTVQVETTEAMYHEVVPRLAACDIFISAAAPSDFKVKQQQKEKLKKETLPVKLELEQEIDILKTVGRAKERPPLVVGFAAETERHRDYALEKLEKKNLDYIVVNNVADPEIGFATEMNQVTIIDRQGKALELEKMTKMATAKEIWRYLYANRRQDSRPVEATV